MRVGSAISKINIFLSLSAVALAVHFALMQMRPYSPLVLNRKVTTELMNKESTTALKGTYVFDEKIFKKKQLFGESVKKKAIEAKKEFVLLGVSMGDKNLAMIRDVTENRDYYCIEGDRIGDFRVKQILKDKVILEADGKILEISQ